MREIRVVDADGNQMGVMTPREALDIARERGLDLIEVAANAVPPMRGQPGNLSGKALLSRSAMMPC